MRYLTIDIFKGFLIIIGFGSFIVGLCLNLSLFMFVGGVMIISDILIDKMNTLTLGFQLKDMLSGEDNGEFNYSKESLNELFETLSKVNDSNDDEEKDDDKLKGYQ